jgi:hypothetical protein
MTTQAPGTNDTTELRPEVFDDYKAFVKEAVREYYDLGWKQRRGNFIALVIASGQALSLARMGADSRRPRWARPASSPFGSDSAMRWRGPSGWC